MLWGWEGDRRSGGALTICRRLCGLSTYGLKAHIREMSTPPMLAVGRGPPLPYLRTLIALFDMLHLVYDMNSPLIFVSLVRYSLLHFHISHMAVHHLHHLHYHHFHHLSLVQSFILNIRLGSFANPFHHRSFPHRPVWFHGLSNHLTFLFCSTAGFVCMD